MTTEPQGGPYQDAGQPAQPYVQPQQQPRAPQAPDPQQQYADPQQQYADPQQQYAGQPQPHAGHQQPYAGHQQPYAGQQPQPGQQPYAGQQPQPGQQQYPPQPAPAGPAYDYQPPPQPDYLQSAPQQGYPPQAPAPAPDPFQQQPGQQAGPPQAGPAPAHQAPSPYDLPLPPPPGPVPDRDPGRRPGFDGPLPDAPADSPPLQWGTPLSAAAPAPRAPGKKPLSVLAIVTLVFGALAGVPALVAVLLEKDFGRLVLLGTLAGGTGLALVLGVISLIRCRGGRRRGAALAATGMLLAALWGAGAAYAVLENSGPEVRDAAGKVVRKGDVPVTTLKIGDCVEKWAVANTVGSVTVLPCTMNHDAEVFHTLDATGGDAFPGDQAITTEATTQCVAKAKTSLKPEDLAKAKVAYLKPVEASWKPGQKQITCIAVMPAALGRSIRK